MKKLIAGIVFFSCPFLLAEPVDFCGPTKIINFSLCAESPSALKQKVSALNRVLEEDGQKRIPEKVLSASEAVFQIAISDGNHDIFGGTGFFLFDNRTFVTNHHVLSEILYKGGLSDWKEVAFMDQKLREKDFHVEGVKFLSAMNDIAVLEVEGYSGPALELAEKPPGEQSYAVGYPGGDDFEVHFLKNVFDASAIHYGAFTTFADCALFIKIFSGSSGAPLLNKDGEVEGALFSVLPLAACDILLAQKPGFLKESYMTWPEAVNSIPSVKEMIKADIDDLAKQAQSGNITAAQVYSAESFEVSPSPALDREHTAEAVLNAGHDLMELAMLSAFRREKEFVLAKALQEKILGNGNLLSATYYEMGFFSYEEGHLQKACEFWRQARDLGHPYIAADTVTVPHRKEYVAVVNCKWNL